MYDTFIAPFTPQYMQRALLEVLLIAIPAGLLGAWVVVRRLAFLSHAVGHATFPALVIALLAGWSLRGTSIVAAIVIALVLGAAGTRPELRSGTAVAVLLSTSLALGAVLVSDIDDPGIGANSLLFGSIFGLADGDLVVAAAVAVLTAVVTAAFYRGFVATGFGRRLAASESRRPWLDDLVLLLLLAVSVAISARIIGSLLVSGLFLIPSATVRLVVQRIGPLMRWGVVLAACEGVVGLWAAATFDIAPGPCIAALAAAVFCVVALARQATAGRQMRTAPT